MKRDAFYMAQLQDHLDHGVSLFIEIIEIAGFEKEKHFYTLIFAWRKIKGAWHENIRSANDFEPQCECLHEILELLLSFFSITTEI